MSVALTGGSAFFTSLVPAVSTLIAFSSPSEPKPEPYAVAAAACAASVHTWMSVGVQRNATAVDERASHSRWMQ